MDKRATPVIAALVTAFLLLGSAPGGDGLTEVSLSEGTAPPESENVLWWGTVPAGASVGSKEVVLQERGDRTYAFFTGSEGLWAVDVTNPEKPNVVGKYLSNLGQGNLDMSGDVAVVSYDSTTPESVEGNLDEEYPRFSHHIPDECPGCEYRPAIELVDVSEPDNMRQLSTLPLPGGGAHASTIAGDTIYSADLFAKALYVIDASDREDPKLVSTLVQRERDCRPEYPSCQALDPEGNTWLPHDLVVDMRPNRDRLYVAAIGATFILDINHRDQVKLVSKIEHGIESLAELFVSPPEGDRDVSEIARVSPDGRYLVVADEDVNVLDNTCFGGMHVYDIKNERKPKRLGKYFMPPVQTPLTAPCTAHIFTFLPDRNVVVAGWHKGGGWVVDLSEATPEGDTRELNTDTVRTTWGKTLGYAIMPEAWLSDANTLGFDEDGRLFFFGFDWQRGMDIYEYVGDLPGPLPQDVLDGSLLEDL